MVLSPGFQPAGHTSPCLVTGGKGGSGNVAFVSCVQLSASKQQATPHRAYRGVGEQKRGCEQGLEEESCAAVYLAPVGHISPCLRTGGGRKVQRTKRTVQSDLTRVGSLCICKKAADEVCAAASRPHSTFATPPLHSLVTSVSPSPAFSTHLAACSTACSRRSNSSTHCTPSTPLPSHLKCAPTHLATY